jgi:hypothetical protein
MATTVANILTASFYKVGIDTPTSAQQDAAFNSLNRMIESWGAEGLCYSVTSESQAVTTTATYTIGATADSGDWDTPVRPLDLLSCFLRDSDNYDHPVRVMSWRDWNDISYKAFSGRPVAVYFIPEYPLAKVVFDSTPDTTYTAYFEWKVPIQVFASITTTASSKLPTGYLDAIVYNLAVQLAEDWGRNPNETVYVNAVKLKENLEKLIASQRIPPKARFDFGWGGYNIETDEYV